MNKIKSIITDIKKICNKAIDIENHILANINKDILLKYKDTIYVGKIKTINYRIVNEHVYIYRIKFDID